MIRNAMLAAMLAATVAPAAAQGRPDVRQMTCGEVRSLIAARGAVVLTTGRHTYDRFVAYGSLCSHPQVAMPMSVRTRDTDRCVIYNCQLDPFEDTWDRR